MEGRKGGMDGWKKERDEGGKEEREGGMNGRKKEEIC